MQFADSERADICGGLLSKGQNEARGKKPSTATNIESTVRTTRFLRAQTATSATLSFPWGRPSYRRCWKWDAEKVEFSFFFFFLNPRIDLSFNRRDNNIFAKLNSCHRIDWIFKDVSIIRFSNTRIGRDQLKRWLRVLEFFYPFRRFDLHKKIDVHNFSI